MIFNDRRNLNHLPTDEDYERPLDKAGLTKANKRFRQSGVSRVVGTDTEAACQRIKEVTKKRRHGLEFSSVGEYLDFLRGTE